MKRLILISFLFSCLYTNAQLVGCTHEVYYTDDGTILGYPEGYSTYRIYIDLEDPADYLSAMYAAEGDLLVLGSSTNNIWNDPFGAVTGEMVNPAFFVPFPSAEFDSFVTIGRANSADPGGAITAISTLPSDAFLVSFGIEPGPNLSISDGAWFTPNGNVNGNGIDQGGPGPYRVLIAQITTDADVQYMLNAQIFDEGDGIDGVMWYVGNPETVDGTDINGFPLGLTYPASNCNDPGACNYNNFPDEEDNPDSCEYVSCAGCSDDQACNYNPDATIDDGSCLYILGCTDPLASNYNIDAECEDGSCLYGGCLDPIACNYDPEVDFDDGSCNLPDGCTNPLADNFDPDALCDDGSCTCSDGEFVYINMWDAFGDGWNGATWTISDENTIALMSGTMEGTFEETFVCLPSGCYYFGVMGGTFPTEISWEIVGSFGTIEGGAPEEVVFSIGDDCIVGCLDPSSCNYDEGADISFGCDYTCIGCTDPDACNYEDDNTIDDGQCLYYAVIQGYVFNDANQDGIFDTWNFGEPGLANTAVTIEELGQTTYTNDEGFFQFFNVPAGTYTISVPNIPEGWTTTTDQSLSISTTNCLVEDIVFGLTAEDSPPFWLSGPCCIFMMDIHCDFGFNPGLWVHNTGSTPLNGTITVAYDEVLEAEALWGAEEPTTIEPGLSTWVLDNSPMGGQNQLYQIHILGPGPDYIGQEFPIDITLTLEDDEGTEYYNNTWTLYPIVVCAYDPNDKYAEDDGYSDEHFVLAEDEIEYRIRFQNTGNFPATDVVIKDTLDIEKLDLNTFYPVFGSHSFMTCVQPDGAVEFVFNEIMLPDSAMDEPGSQGYVVYRIKSFPETAPGEVINNTAHIFFDLNPAVVTNTTWHTIYECGSEALFEVSADELCAFEELSVEGTHPWTETYDWSVDGMDYGTESGWEDSFEPGDYDIMLTASNPICDPVTETLTVTVNPLPTADITENGVELTAPTASSYQWYFEGEPIDGATDQQFTVEDEGWYSVEITNEFGCSDLSDEVFVMVTGINDHGGSSLVVFPNPMTNSTTLLLDSSADRVDIIDGRGRIVQSYSQIFKDRLIINKSDMTPGQYIIRVVSKNTTQEINLLVK